MNLLRRLVNISETLPAQKHFRSGVSPRLLHAFLTLSNEHWWASCERSASNKFRIMASRGRPERQGPPEFFYGIDEARKYTQNSRIMEVQVQLAERAVELLALPPDTSCLLLDLGCGSGLSGDVLTESSHVWIGADISPAMLDVAQNREAEGDLLLMDLGQGLPFRPGAFDGVISISALQWLCNANSTDEKPHHRLYRLFATLYAAMSRGARAVFQFYPENEAQQDLITQQAKKAGFTGGIVIDYPNSTKARKLFLVLFTGGSNPTLPAALDGAEPDEIVEQSRAAALEARTRKLEAQRNGSHATKGSKQWIQHKKERWRALGKKTAHDSKYTGKKRSGGF